MMKRPFLLYVILALVLSYVPFISLPFNWIETYFHEISHGLVAILTGGKIDSIAVQLNGSGLCVYRGGNRLLTAFSGYMGASLIGAIIYIMARQLDKKSRLLSMFMIALVLVTLILWARDTATILILLSLVILFYTSLSDMFSQYFNRIEEFVGVYIMVNALRSPFHLVDGKHYGDGATLSDITGVPELIWVLIWVLLGVMIITGIWFYENKFTPKDIDIQKTV